ncbi:MAG: menaquinone-dependent protoporphyrinogen IX dehydrogenase [Propionivibrio sp.]
MSAILVLYSTVDGHTLKICESIAEFIEGTGHSVTLARLEDAGKVDVARFDKIVIGASIRYGKHRPSVFEFIEANLPLLDSKPNAFFTVNIVARKPEKNRPETNPYLRKFLQKTSWKPRLVEVFAGRLDYPRYRPLDRMMIRFIMRLTNGPTDPSTVVEFTDWQQVARFAQSICEM